MKLIIQIPCFNEERTLPAAVADLPRAIPGIETIEYLVIDDGSTDRTAEVARELGVHHIVSFTANRGLARAFASGLEAALTFGADIIVNTDGDNQYCGADIARLVQPILDKEADIVIGARDIASIEHFSPIKKLLQKIGSGFVRAVSGTHVADATSGFRAYSREAAMRVNVFSDFTYTLETIIQAGMAGIAITHVPIRTNGKLRESRLFTSLFSYIAQSLVTVLRIYTMYRPLKVFSVIGGVLFGAGCLGVARFLYYYLSLPTVQTGHIQSLIIAAVLIMIGFQIFLYGLMSDITAKNRRLLEDMLLRMKRADLQSRDKS